MVIDTQTRIFKYKYLGNNYGFYVAIYYINQLKKGTVLRKC